MSPRLLIVSSLALTLLIGTMAETASARPGSIKVKRLITLNIERLGPGTARYFGAVELSGPGITSKPKQSGEPPEKKELKAARRAALGFCLSVSESTLVQVHHLSTPPFLIGQPKPDELLAYTAHGKCGAQRRFGESSAAGRRQAAQGPRVQVERELPQRREGRHDALGSSATATGRRAAPALARISATLAD